MFRRKKFDDRPSDIPPVRISQYTIPILPQPNELSQVDEDIRKVYEGTTYTIGLPTQAQLVKELRLLRELLSHSNTLAMERALKEIDK